MDVGKGSACLWQSVYLAIVPLCVGCMCVCVCVCLWGTRSALVLAEPANRNSSSHLRGSGMERTPGSQSAPS